MQEFNNLKETSTPDISILKPHDISSPFVGQIKAFSSGQNVMPRFKIIVARAPGSTPISANKYVGIQG